MSSRDRTLRTAGRPLYRQVYDALRRAIARGDHPEGATLPTEGDLTVRFGVSRITVRHALQLLAGEGYIRKRRAHNATVIARQPAGRSGWLIDSVDDIIAAAGDARLSVQSWRPEPAPELAAIFGVDPATKLPCLRSVLLRDRRAYARSIIHFHPRIGARLRRADFDDVIVFRVMQRVLGVRLADVKHSIGAALAGREDARQLGCRPGAPMLATQLVYRDERGEAVEIAATRYPAARHTLTYTLTVHGRR